MELSLANPGFMIEFRDEVQLFWHSLCSKQLESIPPKEQLEILGKFSMLKLKMRNKIDEIKNLINVKNSTQRTRLLHCICSWANIAMNTISFLYSEEKIAATKEISEILETVTFTKNEDQMLKICLQLVLWSEQCDFIAENIARYMSTKKIEEKQKLLLDIQEQCDKNFRNGILLSTFVLENPQIEDDLDK